MTAPAAVIRRIARLPVNQWWAEQVVPQQQVPSLEGPRRVLRVCGIKDQAVERYLMGVSGMPEAGSTMRDAAEALSHALWCLGFEFPTMSVAAAVEWAILAVREEHGPVPERDLIAMVSGWDEVGLVEKGPLYAAAGLTPAEAAQAIADKSLDLPGIRAMAALRGYDLPL